MNMFAVGRIGSYISRGVYTVSGPFTPLGGAVDIVVVEQQDGTFKSSPWYVRFGKYQGVLRPDEKVVKINVNGVDAEFNMLLDHKGEAFFLQEVDAVDVELEPYASSGDEMDDVKPDLWRTQKSRSCNFDSGTDLVSELDGSNGKSLGRSSSRKGRVFGLPFGRRSMKENGFLGGEDVSAIDRASSTERAEIATDLMEMRWSTNLSASKLPPPKPTSGNGKKIVGSSVEGDRKNEVNVLANSDNYMEIFSLEEAYMKFEIPAGTSYLSNSADDESLNDGKGYQSELSESFKSSATADDHENEDSDFTGYGHHMSQDIQGANELCHTSDNQLACDADTSPICSRSEGLVEGINMENKVPEEVSSSDVSNLENPTPEGPCSELSSEVNPTGTGDLSSLTLVSDEISSTADVDKSPPPMRTGEFLGDSSPERSASGRPSDKSAEEQFYFSDFDDHKEIKDEQVEASVMGSEECPPQDFPESSEDEVAETNTSDEKLLLSTGTSNQGDLLTDRPSPKVNSNSVSSPIVISKLHKGTDEQALPAAAESLPDILSCGNNLTSYEVRDLLGRSLDSNLEAIKIVKDVLVASDFNEAQQQVENVQLKTDSSQVAEEIKKMFCDPAIELSLCRHLLSEGMGYEAAALAFDAEKLNLDKFSSLGPDVVKNDKLVVRIGGLYFPWDAALPIASAIGSQAKEQILEPKGMIAVGNVDSITSEEVPQKSMNSRSGSWKLWPFSRSNSMQNQGLESERASESGAEKADKADKTDVVGPRASRKKIRAKAPTSVQLASLNLKEGRNEVTFTFWTEKRGNQQVDARIFLWKWDTRIVISDVDGTITKSDVLGQFMPLVGMDWSQTGVTHLFSAIKENGYQLLFLSARSISQAYQTRQFLFNLKQDGKELPEGPMLISPDGLFPSLYREVIKRAPHEFKISCLEDIKALFPSDHNPFYAGFGNRDTDEISYLRVGIPIGKIFIINPKGQIAVNRRVDTKSYTSLHDLVHGMFPPTPVTEQEDYNSWNFWRLPPPDVI